MAVFRSLGQLGEHLAGTGIEVVDPGMPLAEWDANSYGPTWKNQPSVRKTVSFIARNVASVPMNEYERRGDQDRAKLHDGPLAALLRRPSRAPAMTAMRFWESMLIDGLLHDKQCARIVEHEDGFELVRIPARLVRFTNDGLDRIASVIITSRDGKQNEFDPADFLIDVGYAERGVNGTSPLTTLRDVLDESREAVAYRRSIWKQGARVPGVIERPKDTPWGDGAKARFRESWANFRRGGGQEGGTPVLEDGMKYVESNAFRPRDTLDLEGRKLADIEVASAYHIAPELVGAREGTFSNVRAFKQMLYGPALGPYIVAWEQMLNASLVPLMGASENSYVEANVEAKLRGSFEEQADVLSSSVGAPWMSRNEARALRNMSKIDGGDDLVTPLNVLIGGQSSPQDGTTEGGGGTAAATTADDIAKLVTAAGTLIRAGFDPEASLEAVGLNPIQHLGLLPVTLREDEPKSFDAVLPAFLARQRQAALSAKSAGVVGWWDGTRWDRELATDLVKCGFHAPAAALMARRLNRQTEQRLTEETP